MAGNFSKITINNVLVLTKSNKNGNLRGLHIVIINPFNGNIETSKIFDTYESSKDFENFITNGDIP